MIPGCLDAGRSHPSNNNVSHKAVRCLRLLEQITLKLQLLNLPYNEVMNEVGFSLVFSLWREQVVKQRELGTPLGEKKLLIMLKRRARKHKVGLQIRILSQRPRGILLVYFVLICMCVCVCSTNKSEVAFL